MNKKVLELKEISKSFGKSTVLKDVTLDVHQGEVVVILGPSGCGKSTLLRCIIGLEDIDKGKIIVNNQGISKKTNWQSVRQQIGMVFQNYDLFPNMTVLQNVILGPIKAQKRNKKEVTDVALALLQRVGLADKADSYPRELSGGQKQRVAIVRALILNPEILLFDEVTAALDPEMVREVLDVMLNLAKEGSTMIIVTHEMQFAKAVADKIIFMDDGEIIEATPPKIFFTNPTTNRAKNFINMFNFEEERGNVS